MYVPIHSKCYLACRTVGNLLTVEPLQEHIVEFVKTYNLQDSLQELLEPDLTKYRTFNLFFSRALKPGVRPPAGDDRTVVSAADCR